MANNKTMNVDFFIRIIWPRIILFAKVIKIKACFFNLQIQYF